MFIYRDKYGILHAVHGKATAEANVKPGGPVAEVAGACDNGYPLALGPSICDYGNGEIYIGGNRTDGKPLAKCDGVTQYLVNQFLQKVKEAGI